VRQVALALLLVACKDKSAAPASAPATPARPAAPVSPALPADAAAAAPQPLSLDDASAHLPKLDSDALIPLRTTADGMQAHATWCLAGPSPEVVAGSLGMKMAAAGYGNLATRGDSYKAGVSGERDDYRLSYVVSASTAANCQAPGHYLASATLFRAR
jgi:hypothetical protein